ncbi:MAG: glycine zipper 2TM domain-containing protein [Bradyrhizobiaceae bacterium]|nr:MAG: glycine zipper 2TM domain-containing protein [Bradyrhizobiaceae bacterium]
MRWVAILIVLLGLAAVMPLTDAMAQSSAGRGAVIGGASGAIIGGAIGGGRGAAIGAAVGAGTGAVAGNQRSVRYYYWRHNRCWARLRNGQSRHASNHHCRR